MSEGGYLDKETFVAELRAVASAVEAGESVDRAFETVRTLTAAARPEDPRRLRREMLRRIWYRDFPGLARSAAARLIAVAWREAATRSGEEVPDTLYDRLAALGRAGIRPIAWRMISDDLDEWSDRFR